MEYIERQIQTKAFRLCIKDDNSKQEMARAFIFLIYNDLHERPYALLEDVYVSEQFRSKGLGKKIVKQAIEKAKELNCYKILATSRQARKLAHKMYLDLGFTEHGKVFRMNF